MDHSFFASDIAFPVMTLDNPCACHHYQSYKSELEKLEPPETIQPRIAEKNARMREIQREIGKIGTEQQSLHMERQQHDDQIRRESKVSYQKFRLQGSLGREGVRGKELPIKLTRS